MRARMWQGVISCEGRFVLVKSGEKTVEYNYYLRQAEMKFIIGLSSTVADMNPMLSDPVP
jgi:hypothetical protein